MILNTISKTYCRRVFLSSLRKMSETNMDKMTAAQKVAAAMSPTDMVKNVVKVSDWNKRLLVFSGRFKTMAEIPNTLPFETVDKARNWVRVKVANIMMLMTIVGCLTMAFSGKQAAEAGMSVTKMNQDWHKDYNERAKKEAEEAAAAKH